MSAKSSIDENQNLKNQPTLVYKAMKPKDNDEVMKILFEHFFPREPLTQGLLMVGQDSIEWLKLGMPDWLASGVGVVATDMGSGEMAGCVISKILTKQDNTTFNMMENITNLKAKKLMGIASELEAAVDLFRHYSTERGLELAILTVSSKHGGRGVGRRLVEESERLAQSKGCQFSVAQATGLLSQRIFDKLGYETLHEMKYKGYEYNGESLDTSKMAPHTSAKVMAKRLATK